MADTKDYKTMQLDCSICKQAFNSVQRIPMILCTQQHLCCKDCVKILFQSKGPKNCPQCRQLLNRQRVVKFRLFQICQQKIQSQKQKENKCYIQIIRDSILLNSNTDKQYYQTIKSKAQKLLSVKDYQASALLLESLVEKYPNQTNFLGIGSKEEERGLCQNCELDWYKQHYKVNNLNAQDMLSFTYLRHPQYQIQKKFYERMLTINPNNYKILFGLSLTEHNKGNLDKALSLYQKVIKIMPSFSKGYEQIAFIYNKKDKQKQALKYSSQCLKLEPNNIFAMYVRVNFLEIYSQTQSSIKAILKIQPKYSRVINQLGNLFFCTEKYEDAIQQYTVCISLNKEYLIPIINIGKCYNELSQYDSTVKTLLQIQNVTKSQDQEQDYCLYLAIAYSKIHKQEQSMKLLKRCLQINPSNEDAHEALGQVYKKLGKDEDALDIYKKMLKINKSTQTYSKIVEVLDLMENYSTVTYWLREWERFQPNNIKIYALFADNYYNNNNWNQCIVYCKKCIDKKHQVARYYGKSIVALEKMKRYQQLKKQIKLYVKQCDISWEEMEKMGKLGAKIEMAQRQKKNPK